MLYYIMCYVLCKISCFKFCEQKSRKNANPTIKSFLIAVLSIYSAELSLGIKCHDVICSGLLA